MKTTDVTIENTKPSDYEMFKGWWTFWRFPVPSKIALPDDLSSGLMVYFKGKPVCGGYLYSTSASKAYMLEFIVSNPEMKDKVIRKICIEALIKAAIQYVRAMDGLILYSTLANQSLINHYVNCGFTKGSVTYEMIKVIQ